MDKEQEYPSDTASEPTKSRKRRIVIAVVGILILIAILGGIGGGLYVVRALQPVSSSEEEIYIHIPAGASSPQIAGILSENGLIRNSSIFMYYLKWKKEGSRFQAGDYKMKRGMTIDSMIAQLNAGQTVKEDMIRITIPEGYTVEQIADRLGEQTPWKPELFMQQINRPSGGLLQSSLLTELPDQPEIRHRLEGYLFPETYEFKKGTTEEEFVSRTLQELDKKLGTLPPDWKDKLKEKGFSLHQLLTVASLVEREVMIDEERPIVAGVIYNRLTKKMPLQIDATIQYLFDKPKERILEKDLRIESPYNTYLNPGLPPGPIASPSLASIKAALYPENTPYFYYVTKKDGSKRHLFAVTYEEHQRNIAASKKGTN